ncbi:hypothetical protein M9458_002628, partial [Cirrhinus mrigala]
MDCGVGLLIGYDFSRALAPRQVNTGGDEEPYPIKTDLGWSIIGGTPQRVNSKYVMGLCHRMLVRELPPVTPVVIRAFELDFADTQAGEKGMSQDDVQFLQVGKEGIHQNKCDHLEMPLPYKTRYCLPTHKKLVLVQLKHLKGKLDKDPQIFDCSAKYESTALNDNQLTELDLANWLIVVLCHFRKYPITSMCEMKKMFRRFHVIREDQDYLCFLWWANGAIDTQSREYRMKVHFFGASFSPGCDHCGLKYLASMNEKVANKLIKEVQAVCAKEKLHLHKCISNSREVLESITV